MLALPIFPVSHPTSIFGACELNFCVRYGNRWTLTPISTNYSGLHPENRTPWNFADLGKHFTEPANYQFVGQALGLLVSVSYTPYGASTSDLSTS